MLISFLFRLLLLTGLAILTQVGVVSYLLSLIVCRVVKIKNFMFRFAFHTVTYVLLTLFVVPPLASYFGREPVAISANLKPANYWLTVGLNRNYVVPELNNALQNIANNFSAQDSQAVILFLDASFPFLDGYPLLPHLSHKDGKKIDLSYVYQNSMGKRVDFSPARSGYGYFEEPQANEENTTQFCKSQGYFQYDYPKYLTLGVTDEEVVFSQKWNLELTNAILSENKIQKVFIEPHLVERLGIHNNKVKFHGCRAVRHDDHIHIQL